MSVFRSLRRLALLITATLSSAVSSIAESPWTVDYDARYGFAIHYKDVPVIRRSTLYVVAPGWSSVHYNQENIRQKVERLSNPAGPAMTVQGDNEFFSASYRMTALDDRRFQIFFEGQLKQNIPALIEYAAGYFNADLIANVPFRGKSPAGIVERRVPVFPDSADQTASDLLPNFEWLEFDSRIGKLRVDVDADGKRVMFFDARRGSQPWAQAAPIFWTGLGVPARKIEFGQPVRFEMTIQIDPAPIDNPSEVAIVSPDSRPVETAQSPRERPLQIIPTPKNAQFLGQGFHISQTTTWQIRQIDDDTRLPEALRLLLSPYGLKLDGQVDTGNNSHIEIRIGETEPPEIPAQSNWFSHPEGYRLISNERGITIVSSTAQGAFYGLQTLSQLLRPDDSGAFCSGAIIEDWPVMDFRGAHWFPSQTGIPFHEKLIERIMARYKMNNVVIQTEAAHWKGHENIADANSISLDGLQNLVDLSRRNFLNPIPLINVPGHANWIFRHRQNLHLVEDPDTPYAYCVNHPGSFAFIEDILTQTIEMFRPDTVHLGHDEVTMVGKFPHPDCPRCQGETATTLFNKHLQKLHSWLRERDIETMIWGDMLLAQAEIPDSAAFAPNVEEAKIRRSNLPEGTIVTDWHYYTGETYPSLQLIRDAGHPAIASTWHRPANIHHFAQAALDHDSPGILQTTWAGFFPDESVLQDALHQFSAFILAAEYAWTGRADPPSSLPFVPEVEFANAYYRIGDEQLPGKLIDIAKIARTPRPDWLGLGKGWDFSGLPSGRTRLADVLFNIPENLVILGGRLAPKSAWQRVSLKIDQSARTIALLNAAAFGAPYGTPAATLLVTFADGTTARSQLSLGTTTAAWNADQPVPTAPIAWQKTSPADTPIALRVTRWTNPHPEKKIAQIDFEALPGQACALAGLTLID